MFGFTSLFSAIRELTAEILKSRDYFRKANAELAKHVSVEVHDETAKVEANGHTVRRRLPIEK